MANDTGQAHIIARVPASTRTCKISSVAYATDESASDENTANACTLDSRSRLLAEVGNGEPNKRLRAVSRVVGRPAQRLGESLAGLSVFTFHRVLLRVSRRVLPTKVETQFSVVESTGFGVTQSPKTSHRIPKLLFTGICRRAILGLNPKDLIAKQRVKRRRSRQFVFRH
jgi:hypothetical protein